MQVQTAYDIQLRIKDIDFTSDLNSIRIVSSLVTAYQIVTISIFYKTSSAILDDVLGKYPLKLTMKLRGNQESDPIFESIDMELQYVESDLVIHQGKPQLDTDSIPDRTIVNITTIGRKAFTTMSQIVNDVYVGKTPKQIIQDLASKTQAEVIYDTDDENTEVIEQVVIPPTTFYSTIRYLDDNFGLFKGVSNLGFCQYNNKLYIQNLTSRMRKNQTFTISKLAVDDTNTADSVNANSNEKYFLVSGNLNSKYSGSSQFTASGKNINYIVHPFDKLYSIIPQKLDDLCSKYGANTKPPEISLDPNLNEREVYMIGHSGDNDSDVFANVRSSRQIIGLATIECGVAKSMYLLNLVKVGEPVKLKCGTETEVNLSGKYILKSSDIQLQRGTQNWEISCRIVLMRTNKYE